MARARALGARGREFKSLRPDSSSATILSMQSSSFSLIHGYGYQRYTKRLMDLTIAAVLVIIFSPICIVTAILIRIGSEGPIFADVPDRVGEQGKLFYPYKFRSMIVNAYHLLRTDPKFKKAFEEQQKGGNYKIANDPRVTPVGNFIRKHSIDEIPQLINVLRGEMSIVGPRPYYPEELEAQQLKYPDAKPYVKTVLSGRPGITGLWQVSGRSEVNFDKRIALDAYYVESISLWKDLGIILRTPWVMISAKGAI